MLSGKFVMNAGKLFQPFKINSGEEMDVDFILGDSEFVELNNVLKATGICESGGRANTLITAGQVKVDGNVELRKRRKIRKGQNIELSGVMITVK